MISDRELQKLNERTAQWRERQDPDAQRRPEFRTPSQLPVEQLYTAADTARDGYMDSVGLPGEFPYLRGIHDSGYRGRLWTLRMFAGFGRPQETNERSSSCWSRGRPASRWLSICPPSTATTPTTRGAYGEFGTCGVAVSSLADMETLFDGIRLDRVTTSMTINAPAAIIWAMYLALAEKQGASLDKVGGTIQNDILKEYIAQNEYIFPPGPSMRLVTDTVEFGARHVPRWNPISISGYHIREAGSNAVQELAFTLADGFEYVRHARERGLSVDEFAPRLSFFFNVHNNFFEEIGKFRAARRIWAQEMRDTFGATDTRSHKLRFHAQTSGQSLTAQQPENNVVRVSLQALAAVLGGCQSLHTNSKDEAWALPSEEAALQALRTSRSSPTRPA